MRTRILLIVLSTILGAVSFAERPAPPPATKLQPRVLIVFKNGLSWIEHRGDVRLTDGWGVIPIAPDGTFGTVSLTSDETKIDELRTEGATQNAARSATTIDALLARNPGRMVTLRVGDRDVSGRLLGFSSESVAAPANSSEYYYALARAEASGVILLESGGKTTAIQRGLVTAATFDGEISPGASVPPSLRFRSADKRDSIPVRLSYIRPGIGWFPDYSIVLDGSGRAKLMMRATLVDDGEDLRNTDVFFAVGYPNFAFGGTESPLSGRQSLTEVFRVLAGGSSDSMMALANGVNIASQQMASPDTRRGPAFGSATSEGTQGENGDDFFFYSRKEITLAKGERASFPLVEASVKYTDVYTLDIPRETANESYGSRSTEPVTADKVWHSLRLQNPTTQPWTTAPALVFLEGRPIAQETLRYTPALGETTLRLTVANNVVADRNEVELTRERETVQRFGSTWVSVTIEGTVSIRNFKDDEVVVAITREVEGETAPSADLRITRLAAQPRAMNPFERLQWEVPLKGGEKKTIKYQYTVYVRV